ncbi:hypothetical protein V5O48_008329 [Marasmius crinis-equi]|uniref:Epoxide hydrolase N-terminal domain-containing protein n=1 Tax=Marasmius crinis-equi TaxID=585013 RepID=A0ABR3FE97_9AGAR
MASDGTPFKIAVPDSKLENLQKKLELATFPDELEGVDWKYGVPSVDLRRLVARWKDGYDWRKEEKALNDSLQQFTKDIEVDEVHGTLNIHYVHHKSSIAGAIPLLFVHGWPGSFVEVQKVAPLLTQSDSEEHPSFHVVALSLPGFGFSQGTTKPGFSASRHAEIIRRLAQMYGKKHVMAWHTNFPSAGAFPPTLAQPLLYLRDLLTPRTAAEKAGMERTNWFLTEGMGYNIEQSTQPQTLGYALADSPIGLLAWIYEKLHNWTDSYPWSDDEVLTWVSLYYFSRAGPAASLRIYYEATKAGDRIRPASEKPTIPMGVSHFPKELRRAPKTWIMNVGNLVFAAEHTSGGHFAAHERPQDLADDLRKMFGRGGAAYGVVPGKDGYSSS